MQEHRRVAVVQGLCGVGPAEPVVAGVGVDVVLNDLGEEVDRLAKRRDVDRAPTDEVGMVRLAAHLAGRQRVEHDAQDPALIGGRSGTTPSALSLRHAASSSGTVRGTARLCAARMWRL